MPTIASLSNADVPDNRLRMEILDEHSPGRIEAQDFIAHHYAAAYQARLRHFFPQLLVLRYDGNLAAALGFRHVDAADLYLEHYLDAPIEAALAEATCRSVDRRNLVEVGNLVTGYRGGSRWLIAALTAYLHGAGNEWAVFTAVGRLRNAFARLNVPLVPLAAATIERIPAGDRADWGTYYQTDPMVVAANVQDSHDAQIHAIDRSVLTLWQSALATGRDVRLRTCR